ncbi:mercuric transporter MerT family protein [Pseudomonas sp. BN411]|uniref:mercuric transporter MerT family protein n=1 Tax=Pseudomonas sp. BN411 TaxID=2567887 RepID=UPI0024574638|nr:mercuric transporter MerT family protein [Pseudomonas sp. BN411]MDH4559553.1 mercury transporter MerT [Pseudomonas sp. BN411]
MAFLTVTRALYASLVAGVVASMCCIGPAALLALGLGGAAWTVRVEFVVPYRPLFVGVAVLCLGFAFSRVYLVPPYAINWSPDAKCALTRNRRWFWWISTVVMGLLAAPWLALLLR